MNVKIERFFNTAGPINKYSHYFIEPMMRINLNRILSLVHQQKYFVIHSPPQSGKTSLLLDLMDYLNKEGVFKALYINVEPAQSAGENVKVGMNIILDALANAAEEYLQDSFPKQIRQNIFDGTSEYNVFQTMLTQWCRNSSKPIVLLIDEIDSLVGDTFISILRQLRSGYIDRPRFFPQSVILCGVSDVKDYRINPDRDNSIIRGGSVFNIKAETIRLGNFTQDEIEKLFQKHTEETGQGFQPEVFPLIWELTEGQPWLVNALGYETCFKMEEGRDRDKVITPEQVYRAKERLIVRRVTHLDQLADKLKEERVCRVIEPILSGFEQAHNIPTDDIDYLVDLGLIVRKPFLRIANKIYHEVIPRELISSTQDTIIHDAKWYLAEDGRLDMDKLLTGFTDYFRKNFDSWVDGFEYDEAGPQLLLQAYLQRIVNGGGQVEREYGLGRQRTDLYIKWPYKDGFQQIVLELKIRYGKTEKTIEKGLKQTWEYMDACGADEAYLIIFDRRKNVSWKEKIFNGIEVFNGERIKIYGM